MIDRLLGRASLRARIDELEDRLGELREERDRLQRRLDAESERRSEAQSARQEAERRVNRLEDRIAQLEGELDRREDERPGRAFRGTGTVGEGRTRAILDRLESVEAGPEGALTAGLDGEGEVPAEVREAFGPRGSLLAKATPCLAVTDDAGLVSAALAPPVDPEPFVTWDEGFALDRSLFLPTGSFALALVRADLFAMGDYEGDDRVAYRGFESDVKGDHAKGGYSQARFERLRDEQVEAHLDRCREAIAEHDPARLVLVGDRRVVSELAGELDPVATAAVDATGDPEAALEDAFRSFWRTKLYLI